MRAKPLILKMVSMLLLRRVVVAAADALGGNCGGALSRQCGLKTSSVLFQDYQSKDLVVTYEQLKAMLSSRSVQLFDVRNPDEFSEGRIPDATNIPLDRLEETLKLTPEDFKAQFKVEAPRKIDNNIVFHCKTGRRSATALEIAHRLGFTRARHYAGGYSEWAQLEAQ